MNRRPEMLQFIPINANKILEVGCAQGNFSEQLNKNNVETWGIEPDFKSANLAQEKLHKVLNDLFELL